MLTEDGVAQAEKLLGVDNLYDPANMDMLHCVAAGAARAHALQADVDYVVKDGEVIIVDEFTGRLMPGRRWSDGLHQAVEAKEGVKIEAENQTLATITFQNYFRMYEKLGRHDRYGRHRGGGVRQDLQARSRRHPDQPADGPQGHAPTSSTAPSARSSTRSSTRSRSCTRRASPCWSARSRSKSRSSSSAMLKRQGVPHDVLNAKHHEREAEIVAQAGRKGAVTIATNMAGRGTDILLGGNPEFLAAQKTNARSTGSGASGKRIEDEIRRRSGRTSTRKSSAVGGLHILGTERHESRRIDNQLRGRAGRQGDPGSSRFYLSLEDDLMRIFGWRSDLGPDAALGMEEGVPIEHGMVTRADRARAEAGRRPQLRDPQAPARVRRRHEQAARVDLHAAPLDPRGREGKEYILNAADEIVDFLDRHAHARGRARAPNETELNAELYDFFGVDLKTAGVDLASMRRDEVQGPLTEAVNRRYEEKERRSARRSMRLHEKYLLLQVIDQQWKDHLLNIDHLKEGIGLRGYGQRDPLIEYKKESFELFQEMMERIQDRVVKYLWKIEVVVEREGERQDSRSASSAPCRRQNRGSSR